jgi:hypothetical protein
MDIYEYHRRYEDVRVLKNCELFWQGRLASSINTYGFAFSDLAGNAYEMKCRGFFFWRKIELYENGHLADEYYLYGSKRFDVHLNRRLLIVDANERYICSIQTAHEAVGDDWVALYHWECTEDDIQLQVISCLTLHLQGRGQPIGVI